MNKKDRPYTLQLYNPAWPVMFEEEKKRLLALLAPLDVQVEHIGSTAVPGMLAKPQIDMMGVVRSFTELDSLRDVLQSAGYAYHGDYIKKNEQYFTRDAPSGERLVSIHIFEEGNPHIAKTLMFRDYLRTHPAERDLYAEAKRRAYNDGKNDRDVYSKIKTPVIDGIDARALAAAGE